MKSHGLIKLGLPDFYHETIDTTCNNLPFNNYFTDNWTQFDCGLMPIWSAMGQLM